MLRLILGTVGIGAVSTATAAGCGGSVVVDSPTGNNGGGGGAGGDGGGAMSSGNSSGGGFGGGGMGGFEFGSAGSPGCPGWISRDPVDVPANGPCNGGYNAQYVCYPLPEPPLDCGDLYSQKCVLETYNCGLQTVGDAACGPDPANLKGCCYTVVGDCPVGRPFLVGGQARLGAVVSGEGWAEGIEPDVSGLDGETRAALADFWGREALFEHASVASFARFVLQLLAVGAPAELVVRAQRALAEEIEHASLCFGLASAYAGTRLGPSALNLVGGLDDGFDPVTIAVAVASEGCIAESVAALQIAAARDAATDPVIQRVLARVAEQETEHALLSWRYLQWALERGDASLRAAVAAVFAAPEQHVGIGATSALPGDREAMRGRGCLPADERRGLAADALAGVVMPAARALLAAAEGAAAPGSQVSERAREGARSVVTGARGSQTR